MLEKPHGKIGRLRRENNITIDSREVDYEDGREGLNWLKAVSIRGFDISGVEPSSSSTTVLVISNNMHV
jgi:hypothetical protein